MNDAESTRKKWDGAAAIFDLISAGGEKRWGIEKRRLFARMEGKILFLAAGTGLDFQFFPLERAAELEITAIDISPRMLARAAPRAAAWPGRLELLEMDVQQLTFPDHAFDQVFTSCTFCSVPDPVAGLKSLRRVLKPGGMMYMFEHTGSRLFPFGWMLNLSNPLCRQLGPEVNRPTVDNVRAAGFTVKRVHNIFLDVVKTIVAENPLPGQSVGSP